MSASVPDNTVIEPLVFEDEEYMVFVEENIDRLAGELIDAYDEQEHYRQKIASNMTGEDIQQSLEKKVEEMLEEDHEFSARSYALDAFLVANGAYLMSTPSTATDIFGALSIGAGLFYGGSRLYFDIEEMYVLTGRDPGALETSAEVMEDVEILEHGKSLHTLEYDPF